MRRAIPLLASLAATAGAAAQSFFTDACGTSDWFSTCTVAHFCDQDQNGCLNNWFASPGCGTSCPLPFPGPLDNVVIPPGIIATMNGGADVRSFDIQRPFLLHGNINVHADSIFRNGLTWTGGALSASTPIVQIEIPAASPLAIAGNDGKSLASVQFVLDQAATWDDAGSISLSSGARIVNNAFFVVRNDATLGFGGGVQPYFENNGTFRKLNSSGLTTVSGLLFTNNGTIELLSGTLRMSNSGTSYGPITLAVNTAIEFAFGSYNFDTGTAVTGAGVVRDNGTLNLLDHIDIDNFDLTNVLNGPGDLRVVHAMTWESGQMSAGGTTVIPSFATLALSSNNGKNLAARSLQNAGTMTITDLGSLALSSGATFNNSGTVEIESDASINFSGGTGCTFTNTGALRKSGGTGLSDISGVPLNSSGLVDVQSGTLRLSNNGVGSGPFTLDPNAVLEFAFGNYSLAAGASITGDGLARLNGNTYLLDEVPVDHAELTNNLVGPGDLTVGASMNWISGTMSGGGTTIVPSTATLSLTTNNGKNLASRGLRVDGAMTIFDNGSLNLSSGATLDNFGTLEVNGDADVNFTGGVACAFNNAGTVKKTAGNDLTIISGVPLNNTGLVQVQSGTLRLSNNGTSNGPFVLDPNTALEFAFGNYSLAAGASVSGAGLARLNGNTYVLDAVPVDHSELTANLIGPGDLTVGDAMNWISGTMSGGGATIVPQAATLALTTSNGKSLGARAIQNDGLMTIADGGSLNLSSGASVVNNATLDLLSDASINFTGGVACNFTNAGTLRKSGGTGLSIISGLPLNSSGLVDVQTGTLRLSNNGTGSGPFTLAAGTVLEFAFGNYNFAAGAAVTGDGLARMNGNTILQAAVPFDHVELTSNLAGPGNLIVNQSMDWISGTMSGGGTTRIAPAATMTLSSANGRNLANRELRNEGLLIWQGSGGVNLTSSAVLRNIGTFEARSDGSISFAGGTACSVENLGTIRKLSSIGTTGINNLPFNNAGQVDVQTGTLSVSNLTQTAGAMHVAAGATLQLGQTGQFQGGTLGGNGAITGNVANTGGRVQPGDSAGSLSISGAYTQAAAAAVDIELGGTTPVSEYDRLVVGGAATLAGELHISYINGFMPAVGQQFVVLTAGSVAGTVTATGPGQYTVNYTPTSVIVTVVVPSNCPADLNHDGVVNIADFAIQQAHFGITQNAHPDDGDLNLDGDVDLQDVQTLLPLLGQPCP